MISTLAGLPSARPFEKDRFLSVFGGLFPEEDWSRARLDALVATATYRTLPEGTTLLREGQVCAAVPFVLEGSIRVFKTSESGREITLYRIESGQSCVLSLGCGRGIAAFPANVLAERATSAAFIPSETVREFFNEGPAFRDYVRDQYASRMAEVIELVEEIAFRRVDERLVQALADLDPGDGFIATTHQELADHVGSSREVVSRILKDLEQQGALEISRGSIQLLAGFGKINK